jgi:hypothetical protein
MNNDDYISDLFNVCPIETMLGHTEPHPPVSHTVTLADGSKMDVCADCANSLALGEVLSTLDKEDSE